MTDPDSKAVRGTLRNWPTQPISGVGVPDIADNSFDQHRCNGCTRLHTTGQQLVRVKGPDCQRQQPSTLL